MYILRLQTVYWVTLATPPLLLLVEYLLYSVVVPKSDRINSPLFASMKTDMSTEVVSHGRSVRTFLTAVLPARQSFLLFVQRDILIGAF